MAQLARCPSPSERWRRRCWVCLGPWRRASRRAWPRSTPPAARRCPPWSSGVRNTLVLASVHRTRGSSLAAYQVMRINADSLLRDPGRARLRGAHPPASAVAGPGRGRPAPPPTPAWSWTSATPRALALAVAGRLPDHGIAAKQVDVPESAQYGENCPDFLAIVRRLEAPHARRWRNGRRRCWPTCSARPRCEGCGAAGRPARDAAGRGGRPGAGRGPGRAPAPTTPSPAAPSCPWCWTGWPSPSGSGPPCTTRGTTRAAGGCTQTPRGISPTR